MSLQPLSLCQAVACPHHQDLYLPFQVNMPTRQEILEGLRTLSEEVMESLRILFYMLFALTRAINPNENVTEAEVNPIYRLIEEVKSQRQKISELGNIIANNFLGPQNRSSGPSSPTPGESSDIWELMEEELNNNQGLEPAAMIGQQVQSSSLPMPPTTTTPMSFRPVEVPPAKIAGIPIAKTRAPTAAAAGASNPAVEPNHQLAHTQQTLISWGQKRNTWGKKHAGKCYQETYDFDQGYVRWVLARVGSLGEDIEDFGNYSLTRRRLEEASLNVNRA